MKKIFNKIVKYTAMLAATSMLLMSASCDDHDDDVVNSAKMSETTIQSDISIQTLYIKTESEWTATINYSDNNEGWISIDKTSGNGFASVQVKFDANKGENRSAIICVKMRGDIFNIVVTQFGSNSGGVTPPASSLSTSTVNISGVAAIGATGTFNITSTVTWAITAPSWITVTPSTGNGNATINYTIAENTASSARSGNIVVSGAGVGNVSIIVTQLGKTVISGGDPYAKCYEYPSFSGSYAGSVSETYGYLAYKTTVNSNQTLVTHTTGSAGNVKRNYAILYDKTKYCALWVAYALNSGEYPDNNVGRNDSWKYDPAIPTGDQVNLSSSYGGTYTRGHQIASSDRQDLKVANQQTFYYTNMSPQTSTLNSGQWNAMENAARSWEPSGRDTLYIVTGPVFGSNPKTISKDSKTIPIPDYYFKAFMQCKFDASGNMTSAMGLAFYFDHANPPSSYKNVTKSIDYVESQCGFDLFANVPASIQTTAETNDSLTTFTSF